MAYIIIVDDQPWVAETICAILRRQGHQCEAVSNGRAALRLIELQTPDLLITDLSMPDMNGLELASLVREKRPVCPVLLVTGDVTVEQCGLPDIPFLLKPIAPVALIQMTAQLLGQSFSKTEFSTGK